MEFLCVVSLFMYRIFGFSMHEMIEIQGCKVEKVCNFVWGTFERRGEHVVRLFVLCVTSVVRQGS